MKVNEIYLSLLGKGREFFRELGGGIIGGNFRKVTSKQSKQMENYHYLS